MKKPLFLLIAGLFLATTFTACSEKETPPTPAQATPEKLSDMPFQFTGKLGADNVNLKVSSNISAQYNTYIDAIDADSSSVNYGMDLHNFNISEHLVFNLGSFSHLTSAVGDNSIKGDITKGDHPFSYYDAISGEVSHGVYLSYLDENGEQWNSNYGEQPSTSSFNITETEYKTVNGKLHVYIKASVTCTVFSLDRTQSKQITNGNLIIAFFNQL